jgi:asparagine synthase (glutamine-hydrolysing)
MCGIAGIFAYGPEAHRPDGAEVRRMTDAMANRGPDGQGHWTSPGEGRVILGHRRLSILDLSETGAQPMSTADGRLTVTFNGEIYNYQGLRKDMETRGWRFRSTSDTEVLLALWDAHGPEMVHHLRGMFAFALWDARQQTLFLARDPFGIKPLYFADDGKTLRFASQVKALVAGGSIDSEPDLAGWAGFWLLGYVPDPHTTYRALRPLEAGQTLLLTREGHLERRNYFDLRQELQEAQVHALALTPSERAQRLGQALEASVQSHLMSDVPVGVFLSAGLDSSLVLTLARQAGSGDLQALTLGFREFAGTPQDEVPLAHLTAQALDLPHHVRIIDRTDFDAQLEHFFQAMDQPSVDGLNTYFVSLAAKEAGLKVALSGLGGDELLGGYPSFRQVPRTAHWLTPFRLLPGLGRALRAASSPLLGGGISPKMAGLLEYGTRVPDAYLLRRALFMPWELPGLLGSSGATQALEELALLPRLADTVRDLRRPHTQLLALETRWYMAGQLLRDSDWAGLAHGVEIRVPFVDLDLFRAMAPLQVGPTPCRKQELVTLGTPALPMEVTARPKTGFTTPVREWARASMGSRWEDRGLRGWARIVANPRRRQPQMGDRSRRILFLATDAFGGIGGIARFNRDFAEAICQHSEVGEVLLVPRMMPNQPEPTPPNLTLAFGASHGRPSYLLSFLRHLWNGSSFDLVVCGHINLLPLARVARWLTHAPQLLITHGIEAWTPPPGRPWACRLARRPGYVASVSSYTLERLRSWTRLPGDVGTVFPNTFVPGTFAPGPKPSYLLDRHGLAGRPVLLTVGRMAAQERYKGFDEVLDLMPRLKAAVPGLAYVVVGDGNDRPRLERKAADLGIAGEVIFTGYVPEAEKADHYRLADAYVMPSRGEGFGIVFLEALACGIPVLGSRLDGGRDALLDGRLGRLVDPNDPEETLEGILETLKLPRGKVPADLDTLAFPAFVERVHHLIDRVWSRERQ